MQESVYMVGEHEEKLWMSYKMGCHCFVCPLDLYLEKRRTRPRCSRKCAFILSDAFTLQCGGIQSCGYYVIGR